MIVLSGDISKIKQKIEVLAFNDHPALAEIVRLIDRAHADLRPDLYHDHDVDGLIPLPMYLPETD